MISHINVGTGNDITIKELAELIKRVIGFEGGLVFDLSKPDGTPKKLMNISLLNELGWKASTSLKDGLKSAYKEFQNSVNV